MFQKSQDCYRSKEEKKFTYIYPNTKMLSKVFEIKNENYIIRQIWDLIYWIDLRKVNFIMGYQVDVKKALQVAGNKNKYQYIILVLLCVIFYFDAFLLLGPSFYLMDPTFICDGSDEIVDQKQACPRLPECHIVNDFTLTKYMGLYCERQHERDLIQSLLSAGSLIGLVFMNFLSDLRGRRLALIIDLAIAVASSLLTIIGAYGQSTPILVISSIMAGFSGYSIVIVSYIIAGDFCQQQIRQKSSLYMNMAYSLGLTTYFLLFNWMNQWYNILFLLMLLPFTGLLIISVVVVQEAPNYYLCKLKNKKKCIQSLTNVALYNGKPEASIEQIQKIITNSEMSETEVSAQASKATVLSVLKQWKYLKIIIFMSIVQSGGNLFFYGIEYAIDDIGFNYGIDNLVIGTTEIVVTFLLTKIVSKLPRKKTLFISYLLTVGVVFLFVIKPIQESKIGCTFLIIIVRTLTSFGYFMIVMIQTQSFPLEIHSIGAGTIEAFAQMGSIAAPLVITFAVNHGFEKMATMGVILFFCLIPLKFVPQPSHGHGISKQQLKQTLLDSQIE